MFPGVSGPPVERGWGWSTSYPGGTLPRWSHGFIHFGFEGRSPPTAETPSSAPHFAVSERSSRYAQRPKQGQAVHVLVLDHHVVDAMHAGNGG